MSPEEERHEEEHVVEGVDRFFMIPIFTLLGLVLPWQEWIRLGWAGLTLALLVLLLHRLPILLLNLLYLISGVIWKCSLLAGLAR